MWDGAGTAIVLKSRPFADVEDVKRAVAGYFRITVKQLEGYSRKPCFAHPRQVAMAIARKRLAKHGMSFDAIGAAFGGRHYSTVIFACRKFGIDANPDHPAARITARQAKQAVPMRPCRPPQPRPATVARISERTPEQIKRAYWMRQAGFTSAA